MDQSLQSFLDGSTCRSGIATSGVFDDIIGTLDWLSPKGEEVKGRRPSAVEGALSVPCTTGHGIDAFVDNSVSARSAEPPEWNGANLPGCRVALVAARPRDAYEALHKFFGEGSPTVVEEKGWEMNATTFVTFVAIDVKVGVYSCKGSAQSASSIVIFQHTSQCDIVRFQQLWNAAVGFLMEQRPPVTLANHTSDAPGFSSPGGYGAFVEDDFEDELETNWTGRAAVALDLAASSQASLREEGLQMLASWAADEPESRAAIAEALGERTSLLRSLLRGQTPLAALYPLAATLRLVTLQPSVPSCIAELLLQTSGLPPIIAKELHEACKNLASHTESCTRRLRGAAWKDNVALKHYPTLDQDNVALKHYPTLDQAVTVTAASAALRSGSD